MAVHSERGQVSSHLDVECRRLSQGFPLRVEVTVSIVRPLPPEGFLGAVAVEEEGRFLETPLKRAVENHVASAFAPDDRGDDASSKPDDDDN